MSWSIGSDGGIRHVEAEGTVVLSGQSNVVSSSYTYVSSGQLEIFGDGYYGQGYLALGGLTIDGSADITPRLKASGNLTLGSEAGLTFNPKVVASGSIVLSGITLAQASYAISATGNIAIDGSANFTINYAESGIGSLDIGGNALLSIQFSSIGTGNILLTEETGAFVVHNYIASGAITLGDELLLLINYASYDDSGFILLTGEAFTNNPVYAGSGSIQLINVASIGIIYNYHTNANIYLLGNAGYGVASNYVAIAEGGIELTGSANYRLILTYEAEGLIELSGESGIDVQFVFELNIPWNVNGIIETDIEFTWNTGEIDLYWYRIEGKLLPLTIEATGIGIDDNYGLARSVQMVAARGLYDLADKLVNNILVPPITWPVKSIKRYSCPVYQEEPAEYCEYIEEDVRHIPGLLELTLDENVLISGKVSFGASILDPDGLSDRVASGSGSVVLGSSSEYYKEDERSNFGTGGLSVLTIAISTITAYNYAPQVNLLLIDSAVVKRGEYYYEPDTELQLTGNSRVSSTQFNYSATGSIYLSGYGAPYFAEGGMILSENFENYSVLLTYAGQSGLSMAGEVRTVSSQYTWDDVSGVFQVSGFVEDILEEVLISGKATFGIQDLGIVFSNDFEETELTISTGSVVSSCSCDPLPIRLFLTNNLLETFVLQEFLNRNDYSLPQNVVLSYNGLDNVWRNIYHFNDLEESWRIIFEWGCINEFGGGVLAKNLWKLSIFVVRTKLQTAVSSETRVLITFPLALVCNKTNVLRIDIQVNTSTGLVLTDPELFVDTTLISDEIGLFKGKEWLKYPTLFVNVRESNDNLLVPRLDISPIFPEPSIFV